MQESPVSQLPEELQHQYRAARELAQGATRLLDGLHDEGGYAELREEAMKDPSGFLERRGLTVPDELQLRFLDFPGRRPRKPGPDFEAFTIRQFDCRTYWLWETDDDGNRTIQEVQICWGFEIVPHPFPGGPVG